MSQASTSGRADAYSPIFSIGRVLRLARKELRETLRDRRTIVTLVLMPLLVYPILSFAFNQFLLSSFQKNELHLRIATTNQREWRRLMMLLSQGDQLLKERETSAANTPLSGGPILGAELGAAEPPLSENDVFPLREDFKTSLEDLVRKNDIDLGVRLVPREARQPGGGEVQFQLVYRPNTPISRQAANFVERRLKAVNEHDLQQRLAETGDTGPLRASWRLLPVADEQGHSFWLGTLVPLVLILMTITGAVYPAIDLTAGERERGTLESLMAAPVPRLSVLMAKYIAVLTVAMLTAVVNLTAMTVTIASSGLGPILFGDKGLAPQSILAVLILLALFAAFFSAVLLLITSFARSFKEAQAYLIPLMVVSLAPGYMSVMPGLELGPILSVTPLANIVLLARDVLEGDAPLLWGAVAVLSTILYGGVALALAARVFGSDAILYGSEGSWSDLFRRPRQLLPQPTISGALTTLAVVAPLYVIVSGLLSNGLTIRLEDRLLAAAGMTLLLFIVVPLTLARWQGVQLKSGFQLRRPSLLVVIAAVVLGATLWPLACDSIILCQNLGIATFDIKKLAEQHPELMAMLRKLPAVPPWILFLSLAVAPAIAEESFFRGYLLGALRGRMNAWGAIGLTGVIFGLFHASVAGLIAVDRVASSMLLGIVLGWICWRSGSVVPGMLTHALHNSLMLSLMYWGPRLRAWGWAVEETHYLPPPLVAVTTTVAAVALYVVARSGRRDEKPTGLADNLAQAAPSEAAEAKAG
jgi:sodium transport system permease protein